jgi:glycosyltransferase involved in cell wall biosynthesis
MIEAMACGTPVIAFNQGAVPEIVRHGVTGFIVKTVDQAVKSVERLAEIDRVTVRATFERYFSVEVMATNYEVAYTDVLDGRTDVRSLRVAETDPLVPAASSGALPLVASLAGRA